MKILVIEDEPTVRLGMTRSLCRAGHVVSAAADAGEGRNMLPEDNYDLVITDLMLPDGNGIEILKSTKALSRETGVIIMTAFANVKTAVEAMREGAYDYIAKPFETEEMLILVDKFATHRNLEEENIRLKQELREKKQFQNILGKSAAIVNLCETISTVAKTDTPVIICGETGTGKELVANAIHYLSARRTGPFIKINCAAIPDSLLEAELFGCEKGAFTGATQRRKGKFEAANNGTIFFDEIGDMPLSIQAKLLRALEEMKFERLGGNELISVDVRLLYATARDLKEAVEEGSFRKDLYYRINVLPLAIPPLRQRKEDIPELVRHFLGLYSAKTGKSGLCISPAAVQALAAYHYPGNVRELRHAVEMAVTLCNGGEITPTQLPSEIGSGQSPETAGQTVHEALPLPERLSIIEKDMISRAIEEAGGKRLLAAERLGISRKTLWRKMKELGFPETEREGEE
jgi:DNA-binding NtrC family response regulator